MSDPITIPFVYGLNTTWMYEMDFYQPIHGALCDHVEGYEEATAQLSCTKPAGGDTGRPVLAWPQNPLELLLHQGLDAGLEYEDARNRALAAFAEVVQTVFPNIQSTNLRDALLEFVITEMSPDIPVDIGQFVFSQVAAGMKFNEIDDNPALVAALATNPDSPITRFIEGQRYRQREAAAAAALLEEQQQRMGGVASLLEGVVGPQRAASIARQHVSANPTLAD